MLIDEIRLLKLKELVREKGTLASIADACGTSAAYLSQIINGVESSTGTPRSVGDKLARKIEVGLKKPHGWMDENNDENNLHNNTSDVVKNYPRVVGTAHMGDKGYYLDLDGGDGFVEVESKKGSIAINVRGDSMYPAIKDGWYVIIEPNSTLHIDEYVLLQFKNGKKMVKNLLQIKPDCLVVESVNGGERITAMLDELEGYQPISCVVPPSKHKEF